MYEGMKVREYEGTAGDKDRTKVREYDCIGVPLECGMILEPKGVRRYEGTKV
jgi:hypothetical protein